jgi:hypothetical protein
MPSSFRWVSSSATTSRRSNPEGRSPPTAQCAHEWRRGSAPGACRDTHRRAPGARHWAAPAAPARARGRLSASGASVSSRSGRLFVPGASVNRRSSDLSALGPRAGSRSSRCACLEPWGGEPPDPSGGVGRLRGQPRRGFVRMRSLGGPSPQRQGVPSVSSASGAASSSISSISSGAAVTFVLAGTARSKKTLGSRPTLPVRRNTASTVSLAEP